MLGPRRLFLLLLVLWPWWVSAQKNFHFETFTTRDGLSHNEVRSLLRDRRGFLWIGTANGLNCFDGYQFRQFFPNPRKTNSLGGEVVNALAESPEGSIWIAHNQGLDIYDPVLDTFRRVPPLPADQSEWAFHKGVGILFFPDGRCLLTRNTHKVYLFDPGQTGYRTLPAPKAPRPYRPVAYRDGPDNTITAATLKSDQEAWLSTYHGIFSLDVGREIFTYHPLEGCDWYYSLGSIYHDTQRRQLWFTVFEDDLYSFSFEEGTWKKWGVEPSGFIYFGTDICGASDGAIWTNHPGVLYPEQNRFVPVQHLPDDVYSFPDAATTVALQDQAGILWVGTAAGLTKLDPALQGFRHVELASHPSIDYDNSVYEIFENPENNKWYITSFYAARIFEYDPLNGSEKDITREFRPALQFHFTRIFRDSRGVTWLLADGRLYETDLIRRRLRPVDMPPLPTGVTDRATFDITEDSRGDLWIAKWRAGLLYYDRQREKLFYADPPLGMPPPRTAFVLTTDRSRNTIWLGTHGEGVFSIDIQSGRWRHLTDVLPDGDRISLLDVSGLATDQEDNLWIGTRQGLIRITPDQEVRLFAQPEGLANTSLEGLRFDGRGRLWLATGNGISSVDTRTFEIRNYDERHGLKIDAALDYFSLHSDGTLFSGTRQGFVQFHPDSLAQDRRPPPLALLSFKVGGIERRQEGRSVDWWESISLSPSENFFSIEYAALNFTLPAENTYYYQLKGLHSDWVDAGKNRQATFTKVPPGAYEFCLKAKNKDGTWSAEERRLAIIVRPPFWGTYWFWALVVLLLAGLSYGVFHFRLAQIRREEQLKASFKNQLAKVEMTALRSQMNPHFLFNCLNSINRFIQRNEPDAASSYLTKFSRLIRLVLDNSRSDTISLYNELEALRLYVEMEAMRFVGQFTYEFEIDPELDTSSVEVPPMLIQPYVENAIWHGLMHKEHRDGLLRLKVFRKADRIIIEVEDNGIGREMARLLKSKSATLHKSHGMQVTAERIRILNEIYGARADVRITDLVDARGKAAGTKVEVSLPLG